MYFKVMSYFVMMDRIMRRRLNTCRVSSYKIIVLKRPPGGNLIMRLTFTQPVNTTSVTISGDEPVTVTQSASDTSLVVETVLSNSVVDTFFDMVINTTVVTQVGDKTHHDLTRMCQCLVFIFIQMI